MSVSRKQHPIGGVHNGVILIEIMAEQKLSPAISISFAPAWWYHHYGMSFGRDFWQDPIARTERERDQRRLLFERFGSFGLGERDPQPRPVAGEAYGHRFMSALWGCDIEFIPTEYPAAIILPDAFQRMPTLKMPDLTVSPVVQHLKDEVGLLRDRYGRCEVAINFGGPLNNAVSVLGEESLATCKSNPTLASQVLQKMGEAVLLVYDQLVCPLNGISPAASREQAFGIGNCPVGMIAPATYRAVVLPADLWLRRQFRGAFDLHHCGIFDAYTEVYQDLYPTTLDLGPGSKLSVARKAYPQTGIAAYIEVGALSRMDRSAIDTMVAQMVTDASPLELFTFIRVAEAGPEVSDETVIDLLTARERLHF